MLAAWTNLPLAQLTAEAGAQMVTGFLVVIGTLTVLVGVMTIPAAVSRWVYARRAARQEAVRIETEAARPMDEGVLVAILTAAAHEMLGAPVRVVRHQNARQQAVARSWAATGKAAHFDSHRVKRR